MYMVCMAVTLESRNQRLTTMIRRKSRSVNVANVSDVLRPYGHSLVTIFEYYCLYGEVTILSPTEQRASSTPNPVSLADRALTLIYALPPSARPQGAKVATTLSGAQFMRFARDTGLTVDAGGVLTKAPCRAYNSVHLFPSETQK